MELPPATARLLVVGIVADVLDATPSRQGDPSGSGAW